MRLVGIATFSAVVETFFKRITCEFSGACCFLCPAPTHTGVLCLSRSHRASLVCRVAPYLGCSYLAMKPTAPLLALPCSGMKPPSPLRAMKGHFWAISTLQRCWWFQWSAQHGLQRCWWFQWGAQRGVQRCWWFQWGAQCGAQRCCWFQGGAQCVVQRCWWFQSCPVIACYARKSSPCATRNGCEREKVRPASPKRAKNAVFRRAGRVFSRESHWKPYAGRVFSRMSH